MEDPLNLENLLLDAVNILLESINELPIKVEEDYDLLIEAHQARRNLLETKRAVLSEGWDFNTDKQRTFELTSEGEVPLASNVLDITGNNGDVISRNWRLYSKSKMSHFFDEAPICDVTWDLDFNSLTHPIRHYITIRAARIFQARRIGDKKMVEINSIDEEDARLAARRSETRTGQYNMLESGTFGTDNRIRTS